MFAQKLVKTEAKPATQMIFISNLPHYKSTPSSQSHFKTDGINTERDMWFFFYTEYAVMSDNITSNMLFHIISQQYFQLFPVI